MRGKRAFARPWLGMQQLTWLSSVPACLAHAHTVSHLFCASRDMTYSYVIWLIHTNSRNSKAARVLSRLSFWRPIRMCGMTHLYVWHDSLICVAFICVAARVLRRLAFWVASSVRHVTWNIYTWHDYSYVTWLIHTNSRKSKATRILNRLLRASRDMTYFRVVSFVRHVTWLVHICDMMIRHIHICDMPHSYVWRKTFIHAMWSNFLGCECSRVSRAHVHTVSRLRCASCDMTYSYVAFLIQCICDIPTLCCDLTHSYVWPASVCVVTYSFICGTWIIHVCDRTHSYVWQDSCICVTSVSQCSHVSLAHAHMVSHVTWLIHIWGMTHSYVWHDSFICVAWRIHVWCDSFMCVTWLIVKWRLLLLLLIQKIM